jgi:hypothetical protein
MIGLRMLVHIDEECGARPMATYALAQTVASCWIDAEAVESANVHRHNSPEKTQRIAEECENKHRAVPLRALSSILGIRIRLPEALFLVFPLRPSASSAVSMGYSARKWRGGDGLAARGVSTW